MRFCIWFKRAPVANVDLKLSRVKYVRANQSFYSVRIFRWENVFFVHVCTLLSLFFVTVFSCRLKCIHFLGFGRSSPVCLVLTRCFLWFKNFARPVKIQQLTTVTSSGLFCLAPPIATVFVPFFTESCPFFTRHWCENIHSYRKKYYILSKNA